MRGSRVQNPLPIIIINFILLIIIVFTGVNIDDVDAETVMPTTKKKILNDEEQYAEDIRFNVAIRETFLNRFVHIFLMYENFVIMPDQVRCLFPKSFRDILIQTTQMHMKLN